ADRVLARPVDVVRRRAVHRTVGARGLPDRSREQPDPAHGPQRQPREAARHPPGQLDRQQPDGTPDPGRARVRGRVVRRDRRAVDRAAEDDHPAGPARRPVGPLRRGRRAGRLQLACPVAAGEPPPPELHRPRRRAGRRQRRPRRLRAPPPRDRDRPVDRAGRPARDRAVQRRHLGRPAADL
ncbi:MAG: hypothetical protein AVDCRST_MAG64-2304, partial [uncultured Phycisphaerae bacterium]